MKYPFSRVFGASLVALTLAGCGSKENSDESPAQIIETAEEDKSIYQGVDTPVSIDQGNAETLARVLLSGSNDTPRTSVALQAKAQSVSKQLNSTNSGKTSNTYSALTEITTQSEANEPVVEVIYGSISGTNTVEDYAKGAKTGIVKFTFDEFNNGNGETVYGKLEYNAIVYDPTFELVTESTYTIASIIKLLGSTKLLIQQI
jgi:hypothetical protein